MSRLPKISSSGRFRILTMDHRTSLRRKIARRSGLKPAEVSDDVIFSIKADLLDWLHEDLTGVLVDIDTANRLEGNGRSFPLLLQAEQTGSDKTGERINVLEAHMSRPPLSTISGTKLVVYYRGDASRAVVEHQVAVARRVGEYCAKYDLAFVLEPVTYPLRDDELNGKDAVRTWIKRKPELSEELVAKFSAEEFGADALKIEFPISPDILEGFAPRSHVEFTTDDAMAACARIHSSAKIPWILMSEGVHYDAYLAQLEIAVSQGCSGFMCGRAIWQDALASSLSPEEFSKQLESSGRERLAQLSAICR